MTRRCWNPRRGCQVRPRGELRLNYRTADDQPAVLDVPYCDHHYPAIRRRLDGMGRRTGRAWWVEILTGATHDDEGEPLTRDGFQMVGD